MSFVRKLLRFGRNAPASAASRSGARQAGQSEAHGSHAIPRVYAWKDGDLPITVDPGTITHAFVLITHGDMAAAEVIATSIADFNRTCQPRLWGTMFKARFLVFSAEPMENGFPMFDPLAISALESAGMEPGCSIVLNNGELRITGQQNLVKAFVGFVFKEAEYRIILPGTDTCIPATTC